MAHLLQKVFEGMKFRKFAATSALVIAAMGIGAGTSYAQPATVGNPDIHYTADVVDKSVVVRTDAGSLTTDNNQLQVRDNLGNVVAGFPLSYLRDGLEYPIAAAADGANEVTLTPSVDPAAAHPAPMLHDVASREEMDDAMSNAGDRVRSRHRRRHARRHRHRPRGRLPAGRARRNPVPGHPRLDRRLPDGRGARCSAGRGRGPGDRRRRRRDRRRRRVLQPDQHAPGGLIGCAATELGRNAIGPQRNRAATQSGRTAVAAIRPAAVSVGARFSRPARGCGGAVPPGRARCPAAWAPSAGASGCGRVPPGSR